jgi:hypothetical protein
LQRSTFRMRGQGVNNKTSPAGWRVWLLAIGVLWLATTVVIWWRHDWYAPGTDSTTVTGAIGYSAAYAAMGLLGTALIVAGLTYGPRAWRGVRKLVPRYFQFSASPPDAAARGMGGPSTAPLGVQDTLSWRLGQGIHTTRLIGLAPLEQYQTHGLSSPISIRPSWKMHLLVWGGGPLLFFASVAALLGANGLKARFLGGFGIVFFGFALILFASALIRGRTKGLVEFSTRGMWISTLGITLPWRSIGPAWVNTTKKTDEVVFIVRGIDQYAKNLDPLAALHLRLLKRTLDVGKGGLIDFGIKRVLQAAGAGGDFKKIQEQMEYARTQAASDSSAILLNIPVPFRIGIAPQSLVAILNAEYAKHAFVQADGFAAA